MKKTMTSALLGVLFTLNANAGLTTTNICSPSVAKDIAITGAHFGNIIQDTDGICFLKMWDPSGNTALIWFDANSPVGIVFLSELQLAFGKNYTGMTLTYDNEAPLGNCQVAGNCKSVPGSGEMSCRRLTSLKLQ